MTSSPQGCVCKLLQDLGRKQRLVVTYVGSARGCDGSLTAAKSCYHSSLPLPVVLQGPLQAQEENTGVMQALVPTGFNSHRGTTGFEKAN